MLDHSAWESRNRSCIIFSSQRLCNTRELQEQCFYLRMKESSEADNFYFSRAFYFQ